jgi:Sugar-transfer associated ATP-grasp
MQAAAFFLRGLRMAFTVSAAISEAFRAVKAIRLAAPIRLQDDAGGMFVGANARRVYEDCNLFRGAKYPPVKLAFYPVLREAALLLAVLWLALTAGRIVRKETGKSILSQIADMTSLWFGSGIDPPSYYAQGLYDTSRIGDAPHYLTRYETKNGLLATLNKQSPKPFAGNEMNDKILFAAICAKRGIPHPPTLASFDGRGFKLHGDARALEQDLFCKRRTGMGAAGVMAFRHDSPGLWIDKRGGQMNWDGVLQALNLGAAGHPMLIQPWLKNHPSIADLAEDSLIAFRIITCMNERRVPEATLAMLRILPELEPNWIGVPDEEYAAPIDLDSGALGLLTGDKMRTSLRRHSRHPVTGSEIRGRVVGEWPALRETALRVHAAVPHRLMIGWDIALTPSGPMVLEGNSNFDVMLLQRTHDAPAGRTRFGELLNFHLKAYHRKNVAMRRVWPAVN